MSEAGGTPVAEAGGTPAVRGVGGERAPPEAGGTPAVHETGVEGIEKIRLAMRQEFYSFFVGAHAELHGQGAFTPGAWHMELVAARLQAVRDGRIRRLIVNLPPRHLKSFAASVAFPAWLLGRDPRLAVVSVTYAQELSNKLARDCRALMTCEWYRKLFRTRLASAREPLEELVTQEGGFRLATSVGGVLTGRGADIIVIDDPMKPIEAASERSRRAVNEWFDSTLYSRLNDKAKGAIVIVMQRLHEDDLVGHVLGKGGPQMSQWDVLSLPAIAEEDEVHVAETPFRRFEFKRRAGEALQPMRESLSTLETVRAGTTEESFAAQYQQRPAPPGGGMIKAAWFPRYPAGSPPAFERIVQSWDTANKPSDLADYSVCTTWGMRDGRFHLLDVFRKKLAYPDLKRAVLELNALHRPAVILIEDRASGTAIIQDLTYARLSHIQRFAPQGEKIIRVHAQTSAMENGFVLLPSEAHWLADYLAELTVFPNGRYDDQVDSTAQFLAWTKVGMSGQGWFDYWSGRTTSKPKIRLLAPPGISHADIGPTRHSYVVRHGAVEVEEEDVPFLLRAHFKRDL